MTRVKVYFGFSYYPLPVPWLPVKQQKDTDKRREKERGGGIKTWKHVKNILSWSCIIYMDNMIVINFEEITQLGVGGGGGAAMEY